MRFVVERLVQAANGPFALRGLRAAQALATWDKHDPVPFGQIGEGRIETPI